MRTACTVGAGSSAASTAATARAVIKRDDPCGRIAVAGEVHRLTLELVAGARAPWTNTMGTRFIAALINVLFRLWIPLLRVGRDRAEHQQNRPAKFPEWRP